MCPWNVCLALFLVLLSLSNKAFCNNWLISSTQICQCRWSVLQPCSLSTPANTRIFPSIPFPVEDLDLTSHFSMHSVNICIMLWNSREHAPGLFSLAFFLRTKSAMHSSSVHLNEGNSCCTIFKQVNWHVFETSIMALFSKQENRAVWGICVGVRLCISGVISKKRN